MTSVKMMLTYAMKRGGGADLAASREQVSKISEGSAARLVRLSAHCSGKACQRFASEPAKYLPLTATSAGQCGGEDLAADPEHVSTDNLLDVVV